MKELTQAEIDQAVLKMKADIREAVPQRENLSIKFGAAGAEMERLLAQGQRHESFPGSIYDVKPLA